MNDFSKIFVCYCCNEKFPILHKHIHHKTPRALGGKDTPDNLINICPGCHDIIHNTAWKLLSKKHSQHKVIDAVKIVYKDNLKAQQNCIALAIQVRNAMIVDKEKETDPNQLVTIGTIIRKKVKTLITARIKELKITQEDYIRGLILGDISKRFNLNLSIQEENMLVKKLKNY